MVKHDQLNDTFHALADPTRRGIVSMLAEQREHRIKDLSAPFDMSFAAVSKHIKVLERADLVTRVKRGREHYLRLNPQPMNDARDWLAYYEQFWRERFMQLDKLLRDDSGKTKSTPRRKSSGPAKN